MVIDARAGGKSTRPKVSITPTSSAPIKCPANRADAANDNDHKGKDEHRLTHADLQRQERPCHHSSQASEGSPYTEYQGIQPGKCSPQGQQSWCDYWRQRIHMPSRVCWIII